MTTLPTSKKRKVRSLVTKLQLGHEEASKPPKPPPFSIASQALVSGGVESADWALECRKETDTFRA